MTELLAITLIIVLAAISPGPDFAMVVKNSLLGDRKSGIYTSLGISLSLIIHSAYAILGLAIVISKSLLLFSIIKYVGSGYLIYIGIKSIFEKRAQSSQAEQIEAISIGNVQAFYQGLFCNLLNPKAVMFILAFFTLIIKPSTPIMAQIGYALEVSIIHLIWFSGLAVMITHQQVREPLNRLQHYIVKLMGAALVGFGFKIALLTPTTD